MASSQPSIWQAPTNPVLNAKIEGVALRGPFFILRMRPSVLRYLWRHIRPAQQAGP